MIEILLELLANTDQIITSETIEHRAQLIRVNDDLSQINEMLNRSLNRD